MNDQKLLWAAINAAIDAGQAIMAVYQTDFNVIKKEDESPLTLADQRSHNIISNSLSPYKIPILSEEGKSIAFKIRKEWKRLWVVDPLDGTKEFVKRNDEFTVNIALVEDQYPVMGIIYLPVKDVLYFAEGKSGAYRLDEAQTIINGIKAKVAEKYSGFHSILTTKSQRLPLRDLSSPHYTIVGSRSHATSELEEYVNQKKKELGHVQFISAGSSLKICLVAEGRANIYPRLGPTMEWDTAAGHAIVDIAGAQMTEYKTGKPLIYNKENLLNPWFVVEWKPNL
jgi:3'(2'), 5'-bisphosphate nucleotidase